MIDIFPIQLKGDELHEKLGGGIPKNSIILIEADNGLGKSVLAQRLLYGVLQHDKSATYISTEMTTKGFIKQMKSLNYNVLDKIFSNKLLFLSAYPSLSNVEFNKDFFPRLLGTKEVFEKDVIVFDTLSNLLIDKDINEKNTFETIKFLKEMSSLSKAIIFCVDPNEISPLYLGFLRNVSDIYFKMSVKEEYGTISRRINIERFNGAAGDVTTIIPYKVLAGVGLALEISGGA